MTNLTHAALDHGKRIEALEQRLEEVTASLIAAGVCTLALVRVLLARDVVAAPQWRAAAADVARACDADIEVMPIAGPYAADIRKHATDLLHNNLANVCDAIQAWDDMGRPDPQDLRGWQN